MTAMQLLFVLLISAAVALSPSTAKTADTIEAVANYAGADRQGVLEAGARREGELLI